MHQEEETPRAGNYKPCEDLQGLSSCVSPWRLLQRVPTARTGFRNTSDKLRVMPNIEKNTEGKGKRRDTEVSGLYQGDDYPQCRYLDTCTENESKSPTTSTSGTEERSHFHFRSSSSCCRFVQVRHNSQRHLIALPVDGRASSLAGDTFQGGEDIASILSATFNIPYQYKVVGLIGPLFVDCRGKIAKDGRETSVVLPLALLRHPDAAFVDCYYNEKFAEDGKVERHEFELLLYPRPRHEKEQEGICKLTSQTSEASFIDSEAVSLTSDNLSQEKQPDEPMPCYQLSHAEQADMINIAQVLLECNSIELPVYMALVDGIMKKNQDLSRVYHEHLVRVEESSWDTNSSSSGSNKSKSSLDEFESYRDGRYSYFYQSVDKMMEDIREIACSMKPIFPVNAETATVELRNSAESLNTSSWSVDTAKEQEEKPKISNVLIHAAAILVHQGRISLEAATILVSTFARERSPLVSAIHKYYSIHRDFSQFLNMLEWLSTDGNNMVCCIDHYNGESDGNVKLNRSVEATLDDWNDGEAQRHLDMEYDILFDQVSEWDDFGPLEIATLRICASRSIPGLITALRTFKTASEKGRADFRKAVRNCVDQFLKRQV